ncbi:Tetratricopeptide domain-contaning protein [Candidatus Megaera venefica]|uniref:Tetratricopeptide domain-contaning protein n=1 Tax=Candidatus Megaera venefica TaxID=2055910 RepID=A0ABU5NCS3_9RICK|nr:tetratricopeptide repeat protein [Candidatus Megaera venefica]MEA0970965.1 Tetratricopeptide domain-contaning protein [Candidatus Megaera venefica]
MKRLLNSDTGSDKNDNAQIDQIFNSTNANHFNSLGATHFQLGEFQEAVDAHKTATELDPTNAIYFYNLGEAHLKLGQFQEAVYAHKTATKLDPTNAKYFKNLGEAHLKLGQFQEAVYAHKTATELDPTNAIYFYNLGGAHFKLGKLQEAVAPFKTATELDPTNAMYFNNLGGTHFKLGKLQEAVVPFEKATDLDKTNGLYFNNLGMTHFKLGEFQEAVAPYKKAAELAPTSPLPTIALITPAHSAKEVREIITKVIIPVNQFIIDSSADKSLVVKKLLVEKAKTNIADAMVKYTTTTPVGKSTFLDIALKLYLKIGTEETLDKVCEISKNNNFSSEKQAEIYYSVGNKYFSQKDYNKALIKYQASIELNPKFLDPYIKASSTYLALGQNEEAQQYKGQAATLLDKALPDLLDTEIYEQNLVMELLGD